MSEGLREGAGQGALDAVSDVEIRLADVVDRSALGEVLESVNQLFGIAVRVYANDGALLATAASDLGLCAFINELPGGRMACAATISAAKASVPDARGDVTHTCFSGLTYRIVSLEHDGRRVGRIVLGPYAPAGLKTAPESLFEAEPRLERPRALTLHEAEPRVKPEAVERIAHHLKTTLELVIFSSHKTWVTSQLHLYSVTQGYRELEEKTRRLEQALVRLRELDRLKSVFLATVSHELRTPLTSIIGYSEMLAEGLAGPLSEDQASFVGTIQEKGEQLLALITGLLDLSKMESGTMALRQAQVDMRAVLEEVRSTLTPVAMKKQVTLAIEGAEGSLEATVAGDAERLRQVFLNLVENALKFTPPGGRVAMGLAVSDAEDDEDGAILLAPIRREVVVRVTDTGIGIPKAERDRVFDAFYQVDSSSTREHGGTGLGLSIVKRIVEAHGGSVVVRANEEHESGTVFVVALPTAQAARVLPSRVPPAPLPAP